MSDDPGNFAANYGLSGGDNPMPSTAPLAQTAPALPAVAQQYFATLNQQSPVAAGALDPATLAFMGKYNQAISAGQIQPGQAIGPGGADPKTGLAYSWLPYDPSQQIFDPHQHFGPTYNDPTFGTLQSLYTEPSKSANDLDKIGQALFGIGLSAITAGAGSPLIGGLFNTAMSLGNGGPINPISLGESAIGQFVPGAAPFISAGNSIYQATQGNPIPGAISLAKLAGGP